MNSKEYLAIMDRQSPRHNWQIVKFADLDSEFDLLHAGLIVTAQIERIDQWEGSKEGAQVGMMIVTEPSGSSWMRNAPVNVLWTKEKDLADRIAGYEHNEDTYCAECAVALEIPNSPGAAAVLVDTLKGEEYIPACVNCYDLLLED